MKTPEELDALKEKVEALNKKLAGLNEEELQQICGGFFEDEVFSKDDWIKSHCLINNYPSGEELAYQVLAVISEAGSSPQLEVQQFIQYHNYYIMGPTCTVPARTCWHVHKPDWI